MNYEIDKTKRFNYLFFQFKKDELLTISHNNQTKFFTIRIVGENEKYIHHVRMKNFEAVKLSIDAFLLDRSEAKFYFDINILKELSEVENGI